MHSSLPLMPLSAIPSTSSPSFAGVSRCAIWAVWRKLKPTSSARCSSKTTLMSAESCLFASRRTLLVLLPVLRQHWGVSLYSDKRVGSPPPTVVSEPPQHENLKVDTTEELRDLLRIAMTNIEKPDVQTHALRDILGLVFHQPANQSAAAAAGAVGVLLQLAQSRGDKPDVQIAALEALCGVVLNHPANQIAAGEAGALHDILQLVVRSGNNLRLQKAALVAVKVVVANIPANQSAAGAAGAVGVLLQLAQSSGDKPDVQIAALEAFSPVVLNHPANQIAAGDALGHLLQLAQSSSIAASAAAIALKNLVECSFSNQQACHKIICSSHPRVPAALHSLAAQLQRTFEGSSLELSLVRKLEIWCDEASGAGGSIGAADDVFSSVPTRSTRQIGDTCFAFAAARSFNRSMRNAGIYQDDARDGCRWELAQALRWAATGEVFKEHVGWVACGSGFGGSGFTGGQSDVLLHYLLNQYAATVRWPQHADLFARMEVKRINFTEPHRFAESIRGVLQAGQEPVLHYYPNIFRSERARLKIQRAQEALDSTAVDATHHVTKHDVDPNAPPHPVRHAVVIGGGSMRGRHGSRALVIKDSLWNSPWFVESIDVMVFNGAEDDVNGMNISWVHAPDADVRRINDEQNK